MKKIYLIAVLSVFCTPNAHALDSDANIIEVTRQSCQSHSGACDIKLLCSTKTISCSARGAGAYCELCSDGIVSGSVRCSGASGHQYQTCGPQ